MFKVIAAFAIVFATSANAQFLSPEEVQEGLKHPEQEYFGNKPTPPRPVLNKRDTKQMLKGMKRATFEAPAPQLAPSPIVDLRKFDTPIKNQLDLGYCTAFASAAVLENIAKARNQSLDLSEYAHFQDYRVYSMFNAAGAAMNKPLVPESAWPYKKSAVSGWQSKRFVSAKSWQQISSFQGMLDTLSAGKPVVLGTSTNASWNSPRGGMIKSSGAAGGGHAITIVGFNKSASPQYFIIKNSWGTQWGDRGYGYLPFDYCSKYGCYFIAYSDSVIKGEKR
jgi:C1A family cysteine protease